MLHQSFKITQRDHPAKKRKAFVHSLSSHDTAIIRPTSAPKDLIQLLLRANQLLADTRTPCTVLLDMEMDKSMPSEHFQLPSVHRYWYLGNWTGGTNTAHDRGVPKKAQFPVGLPSSPASWAGQTVI